MLVAMTYARLILVPTSSPALDANVSGWFLSVQQCDGFAVSESIFPVKISDLTLE
jgi:hypothetical protein